MTLYLEYEPGAFRAWNGEPIDGVTHSRDIEQRWSAVELEAIGLYSPEPAEPLPQGKQIVGTSVQRVAGVVRYVHALEDIPPVRRMVRKSTVQARMIEAGLMDAAYAAMTANAVLFARWFAPDQPNVYADDPDALAFLAALGADTAMVMAEDI
ncbi:hypothetical protein [Aminobacter niigataensis]|uniref:hypothetical protein n=1 Tax=Aminobacter niigataensis TaxID=83265 RepID=UPI0024CC7A24|nr:hypothetical protein [Aminobacter niigataensis]CAI2935005.1 protein of unknown function [Aminobacter niigataensis]